MPGFLIIQTAFTGDVVLATALAEKLHSVYPAGQIDFLLRKGNEGLLKDHPFLRRVLVWDKGKHKNRNLLRIIDQVRKERYDHIINPHRFASSGLIALLSGAKHKSGFDKNPFSFCYTRKVKHVVSPPYAPHPVHEVQRNHALIQHITDKDCAMPALYPSVQDRQQASAYQSAPYICIAPASVWFTKQFPAERWVQLINLLPRHYNVFLLGAPGDQELAASICSKVLHPSTRNLCGRLGFLASAALMQGAEMNYVNDSAPLHFCTAMNAPVTAVFCSTVPAFGFGPLRQNAGVVEIPKRLYCRPCGLHGRKACPQGHFRCAHDIKNDQLLWWISNGT